jgi:uncharacterized protein (TIGR02145 family)
MNILRIIIILIFPLIGISQAPQRINFQSVLRNTNGEVVSNRTVSLRISILSGTITGPAVYVETHARTTDAGGLMSLQIGNGTLPSIDFATINWGNSAHFIKLEADFSGGNSYVLLGTQELMSVPYALYASKTDTGVLNLINRLAAKLNVSDTTILSNRINIKLNSSDFPVGSAIGNIMFFNGTRWVNLAPGADGQFLKMSLGSPVWGSAATVAGAPTSVTAVRGNSQAIVSFTAPTNGGSVITGYMVTSNPGGITATGISSPITVTGLTNGTVYTFTVVAAVEVASAASAAVTPATVPDSPTGVVATAGDTWASVAFVAPTNSGGSAITGYTVMSNPGNISGSGTTSPINVTGLTNGTAYTFTVVATNAVGSSVSSSSSTAVTPRVCPTSTITDIDGNTYNTIIIDSQCWMKENLKTSRYRNGVSIPIVTDATGWGSLTTGGRSWYNNDSTTYENPYGNLYNWYALADSIGLCPTGWGVPTDAEWTTLTTYLGGSTVAGGKMKATGTTYWSSESAGTDNSSGFSALPGGIRYYDGSLTYDGSFDYNTDLAFFWSATESDSNTAWIRYLSNLNGLVTRLNSIYSSKSNGASIRCLKD